MILPGPSDATRPFWDAAAQQRLLLRHCPRCGSWLHPQLVFCGCGEWRLEWREASGEARLLSHTIARRMPVPALSIVAAVLALAALICAAAISRRAGRVFAPSGSQAAPEKRTPGRHVRA